MTSNMTTIYFDDYECPVEMGATSKYSLNGKHNFIILDSLNFFQFSKIP